MASAAKEIKWGVLGTARIAPVVMNAIRNAQPNPGVVLAIASRTLSKAQEFAKKHNIPLSYGSYEELLENKEIDAIYIPLPTAFHEEYTIKAAEKGKHVLCEKPLTTSHEAAKRMAAACEKAGVQLMDGVMWVHHNRAKQVKEHLAKIGPIRHVTSRFTTPMADTSNIRFDPKAEPAGALGDVGWYCIKAILFGFSGELPETVFGRSHVETPGGVPIQFSGLFTYKNGAMATFDCGFRETWRQTFEIQGEKGVLRVEDFVVPLGANTHLFPVKKDLSTTFKVIDINDQCQVVKVDDCIGEVKMIEDFQAIIRSGKLDRSWSDETVNEQRIMDALLRSATGVDGVYSAVKL